MDHLSGADQEATSTFVNPKHARGITAERCHQRFAGGIELPLFASIGSTLCVGHVSEPGAQAIRDTNAPLQRAPDDRQEQLDRQPVGTGPFQLSEYRSPPFGVDHGMSAYSFNDHALRRFGETLKDAVDPNGIIAAGRGGIWPKHLRGSRA